MLASSHPILLQVLKISCAFKLDLCFEYWIELYVQPASDKVDELVEEILVDFDFGTFGFDKLEKIIVAHPFNLQFLPLQPKLVCILLPKFIDICYLQFHL